MTPNIIPSIFTAVNGFSAPLAVMSNSMNSFTRNLQINSAKADLAFNNIAPSFGEGISKKIGYLKELAGAMAIIGTATFSAKSLMDYEAEMANLSALTGAAGKDLAVFQQRIEETAIATKRSTVDVAQSFTTVANAMPQLIHNAEGLGQVTKASILLAKAARLELQPAAAAVTDILNQFDLSAKQATETIDLLAAGAKYGSAEIRDLQASIIGFGKIADIGGVTLKESVGLVELVSKFKRGADAGIELRNVLLEMGKNTAQDPKALADLARLGVNIALVADKTKPLAVRLVELSKITNDSNAVLHVFGKENSAMAVTVLQNARALDPLLQNISETGIAAEMAAKNTDTLLNKLTEVKAAWVNMVTTSTNANNALRLVGNTLGFVTDHMEGLMTTVITIATPLAIMYTRVLALRAATWLAVKAEAAYNFALGLTSVKVGTLNGLLLQNAAYARGATLSMQFFGMGLAAQLGLIGAVAVAVGLLTFALNNDYDAHMQLRKAQDKVTEGFLEVRQPITQAALAQREYNAEIEKYNELLDFNAELKYQRDKGFFNELAFRMLHPVLSHRATAGMDKPTLDTYRAKYPGIDTVGKEVMPKAEPTEQKYSYTAPPKQAFEATITINDKGGNVGNVSTTSNSNRATPVKVNVLRTA